MAVVSEMLFAIFFGGVALCCFLLYLKSPARRMKNVPGPKPLPFIGNMLELIDSKKSLPNLMKLVNDYGEYFKVAIGPYKCYIFIADYEMLEFVLSSPKLINKAPDYEYLEPWLGTGLLTANGAKWKKHRKIITPSFHFQILEQFIHVFESNGNILIKKLKSRVEESSVNIFPYITMCSLDVISESAIGTSVNAQGNTNSEYVQAVQNMCRITVERCFTLTKILDCTFRFTKDYYVQKKSVKILHDFTNSMIKTRKAEMVKKRSQSINQEGDVGSRRKLALLDLLLEEQDNQGFSDDDIRQEVDTFLFAGHDTTSSVMAFTLYCLTNNPECQELAFQEQMNIFGNHKDPQITLQNLNEMKYLENVIKESMRLYPAVPFVDRIVLEDLTYRDILIPKGAATAIFIFGAHRNPKFFPDPEKFDPSRFESSQSRHPFSYIPFSAGFRNCVGQKFAMLELKSILSKVIRHFKLLQTTPKHEVELVAEAVIKSANGVCVKLEERMY